MGFIKINENERKSKNYSNLIGNPFKIFERDPEGTNLEAYQKQTQQQIYDVSEILIRKEEILEYQYSYDGKRKAAKGYGNFVIYNNSNKDRIWDAQLKFIKTQNNNISSKDKINLGIFEPNSNKSIKYDILNTDELPDIVNLCEEIEIINDEIEELTITKSNSELKEEDETLSNEIERESSSNHRVKNLLLLQGKSNLVKFTIKLENTSSSTLGDISLTKNLFKDFTEIEFEKGLSTDLKVSRNQIHWSFNELRPNEVRQLTFFSKITPRKNQTIRTGVINLSYILKDSSISGIELDDFSAYSHAMHVINKKEKNNKRNSWECFLSFENHSNFQMEINSILVYDETKSNKILDLSSSNKDMIVLPGDKFKTNEWEFDLEKEPLFLRKIEYSVKYNCETKSNVVTQVEDHYFDIADYSVDKEILEKEIKSFEEAKINNKIVIKNLGSIPIKGCIIKVKIPEDFLPSLDITSYKIKNSSGELNSGIVHLNIDPQDSNPSTSHTLELELNLNKHQLDSVLGLSDQLEITFPIMAKTPDNEKTYDFPLETHFYYSKYKGKGPDGLEEYFVLKQDLSHIDRSSLNIAHKRRKLMVGKEIFPGRNTNEFAINILVKNRSNVKIQDVNITDTFPEGFKLISSNMDHKISKADKGKDKTIVFAIDSLSPYQEKEILYYLEVTNGKENLSTELESFFLG